MKVLLHCAIFSETCMARPHGKNVAEKNMGHVALFNHSQQHWPRYAKDTLNPDHFRTK